MLLATSLIGGAFGFLRKSIGSITYSQSTSSIDGRRKQVARQKVSNVKNPNTVSQIAQRMKISPAHLFYQAFEKAAGSVENNPLSHSWEGVEYGAKSRLRFLQLALAGDPKAYVPKGIKFAVPGVYQVSEGSLRSLPSGAADSRITAGSLAVIGTALTADNVSSLASHGVEVGDQITCLALAKTVDDRYLVGISRVIVGVGNNWSGLGEDLSDLELRVDGIVFDGAMATIACAAFIVSRGISTTSAKRSTAFMTMNPDFASLLSPEAYDAAIDSYLSGVTYNSLNSTWYLNQGSTQAFNGQVFFQSLKLPAIEGVAEETVIALLARQVVGGSVSYVVFTSDGTSAGTIYGRRPDGIATAASWTATRAAAALGNVNIVYAKYTEAIGAQASGNV